MGIFGSKEAALEPAEIILHEVAASIPRVGEGPVRTRIVAISDTHTRHEFMEVPDGDVLMVAGDISKWTQGESEVRKFNEWLGRLPHAHKIIASGNHDCALAKMRSRPERIQALFSNAVYLQGTEVTIAGLRIFGAPWTIARDIRYRGNAFCLSGGELAAEWAKIPDGVDIVLTHSPPWGVLDPHGDGSLVGSIALRNNIARVQPKAHVFGHAHAPGIAMGTFAGDPPRSCLFVNAAMHPTVFDVYH